MKVSVSYTERTSKINELVVYN